MKNFLNQLLIPFAIIHIRIIQHRYEKITTTQYSNQSNQNLATLQLLQAQEYYYRQQFSAWGKFHPSFSFTETQLKRHKKFMAWLFPEKTFDEWNIVVWHKPEAVTYYHNKIFKLQGGVASNYKAEIVVQLRKWKEQEDVV